MVFCSPWCSRKSTSNSRTAASFVDYQGQFQTNVPAILAAVLLSATPSFCSTSSAGASYLVAWWQALASKKIIGRYHRLEEISS